MNVFKQERKKGNVKQNCRMITGKIIFSDCYLAGEQLSIRLTNKILWKSEKLSYGNLDGKLFTHRLQVIFGILIC